MTNKLINQALKLWRLEPRFDSEVTHRDGYPWRCDIYEDDARGQLFASTWGKTQVEARAKANSIVQACALENWTAL